MSWLRTSLITTDTNATVNKERKDLQSPVFTVYPTIVEIGNPKLEKKMCPKTARIHIEL